MHFYSDFVTSTPTPTVEEEDWEAIHRHEYVVIATSNDDKTHMFSGKLLSIEEARLMFRHYVAFMEFVGGGFTELLEVNGIDEYELLDYDVH